MRKHQPRGAGADDSYLRAEFLHATILIPRALQRAAKIHSCVPRFGLMLLDDSQFKTLSAQFLLA